MGFNLKNFPADQQPSKANSNESGNEKELNPRVTISLLHACLQIYVDPTPRFASTHIA
jgi:hypothetical protein